MVIMKRMRKIPALASSLQLFMLLDLKRQAYAWPIVVYSKQDMWQLWMQDICGMLFDNN